MQSIQKLENVWNSLSNELKAKYHYDVGEFIGASNSEQWARDMGLLPEKEEPSPIKETPKAKEESKDE